MAITMIDILPPNLKNEFHMNSDREEIIFTRIIEKEGNEDN
jgi:hypothetical protein